MEAGVPQCPPVLSILFAIHTAGLIQSVEERVQGVEGLSFIDDLGWVGTWKGRQSGGQESSSLCSGEYRVGQQARPPIRHCEDRSDTLHMQERSQEAPPATTHSNNLSGGRLRPVQQRSDMVAGCMDTSPPNVPRASQRMRVQGHGSRCPTVCTDEDARNHPREGKGHSNTLGQSCCTILQRIMVGPNRNCQTRGCSTPPELAGQVNTGHSAHDASRPAHERLRTDSCTSSLRLQTATIRGEASRCMRGLEVKGEVQPPHIWRTNMQSDQARS